MIVEDAPYRCPMDGCRGKFTTLEFGVLPSHTKSGRETDSVILACRGSGMAVDSNEFNTLASQRIHESIAARAAAVRLAVKAANARVEEVKDRLAVELAERDALVSALEEVERSAAPVETEESIARAVLAFKTELRVDLSSGFVAESMHEVGGHTIMELLRKIPCAHPAHAEIEDLQRRIRAAVAWSDVCGAVRGYVDATDEDVSIRVSSAFKTTLIADLANGYDADVMYDAAIRDIRDVLDIIPAGHATRAGIEKLQEYLSAADTFADGCEVLREYVNSHGRFQS